MRLSFSKTECVEILSTEQWEQIAHLTRRKAPLEVTKPIYLEHADSVTRGSSIGIIDTPIGTWSRKPLKVIKFEDAIIK